jgi:hypothetical protein
MTLYLKSCPRDKGDMYEDRDVYGKYIGCLQCGYMVDIGKNGDELPDWMCDITSTMNFAPSDVKHSGKKVGVIDDLVKNKKKEK